MSDILTVEEMYERFDSEWVLIGDPQTDEKTLEVLAGKVLFHSKDREEVYRKAIELPAPKRIATLYTGPILDPDTDILL